MWKMIRFWNKPPALVVSCPAFAKASTFAKAMADMLVGRRSFVASGGVNSFALVGID